MSKFTYVLAFMTATMFQAEHRREEKGASAVEYAILVAAIIGIVGAAVVLFGADLKTKFDNIIPA